MEHFLNCNLELCLSPPSSSPSTTTTTTTTTTVTANTGVLLPDLTELQARAIIVRATRQMEAERRSTICRITSPATAEQVPMKSGANNPSMRRSLQRFLQTRKHRTQTLSPYTH